MKFEKKIFSLISPLILTLSPKWIDINPNLIYNYKFDKGTIIFEEKKTVFSCLKVWLFFKLKLLNYRLLFIAYCLLDTIISVIPCVEVNS